MCIEKQQNVLHSTGIILLRYFHLDDNCALLFHYTASSGNFLPMFRDKLSVPSSRFKNQESCGILNSEDGTDILSQNVGKKLPLLSA